MMKATDDLHLNASDLVGHLNCRHLTELDLAVSTGRIEQPHFHDPLLEILIERGARHERSYLDFLAAKGYEIARIEGATVTQQTVEQTLEAMRRGARAIAQAALLNDGWSGRADLLIRVPVPSALGDWSYEVIDTKLARETKGGTILQLSLYADLLGAAQKKTPEFMHVVTPGSGFAPQSYRTAAFAAYYRHVRWRLLQSLTSHDGSATYPDPVEHCDICRWRIACEARRRADDHLCLVAGISKIQINDLRRHDVTTTAQLARVPLPLPWKPDRGARGTYERVREQARLQVQGRETNSLLYETLPLVSGLGLSRLPEPSTGDVFFDLEADPFVGEGGLEYLFGYVARVPEGEHSYCEDWAVTREEEKYAFERFVNFVMARWEQHPGMHIYHYAAYEPSALKRLMGRYATCEDQIDRMLRGGLFVDLYAIVRQSIRASVERYSIKDLEPLYGHQRPVALSEARQALAALQSSLELDDPAAITEDLKRTVAGYNRDDCLSALHLRHWLEKIRAQLTEQGVNIARPAHTSPEPSEALNERQKQVLALVERLTANVPADRASRTPDQHACWILAYTLDWHRREMKSVYWERFRLADLPIEDLIDERSAISGLKFMGTVGGTAKAPIHRYQFPPQEVELRGGESLRIARTGDKLGTLEDISIDARTLDIKKRKDTASLHPDGAFAHDVVGTEVMADALLRIGEYVTQSGIESSGPYQAARDLLLRRKPRLAHESWRHEGEAPVERAVRIAPDLLSGVLAIQGPPGAGKTFTAARMICALVKAGKTVGITANSHKVIRNLLDEVVKAADALGIDVQSIQKPEEKQEDVHRIRFSTKNEEVLAALGDTCQVGGGTAWLWSHPDAFESVDVLFVDEAAQMSLANVLAVSQACETLVLLGDPQQLEQPMKGSHPEGTGVSALDHLLAGKSTIGEDEGLFLDETWRLHPDICNFTSELFYEGRLRPRHSADVHTVRSTSRINGAGLRYLAVNHEGNQSSSPEEAERIRRLIDEILRAPSAWIDREGKERPIELDDILVAAPYNAQVFELQERLPAARVGTVDKFQGQEAAIAIYSMTTSSHADAPRGMEFLYSLNRLNVATSRAMCLCVLVGCPILFEPECRTPEQMRMANAFCRYLEIATPVNDAMSSGPHFS
jgi:predicted RecB family nuclease